MTGHHGRYLRFDLASGQGEHIPLPADVLRRYIGGVGLGAWLLLREAPAGVDPLAPEAPLVFAFSPLVGTSLTTSAKLAVVAKSPLTGFISDGLSGSWFAIEGKATGVDAIVIVGRASEPCELVNGVLRPTRCWGLSADATRRALEHEGRVAAIGVAGENGVLYASISNDGRHAGRGGLGAVMGAKRLKAIVVRGSTPTEVARPAEVLRLSEALSARSLGPATAKYRELGTAAKLTALNRLAVLPTRNFSTGQSEGAVALEVEQLGPARERARRSCASCTIGCEHIYRFDRESGESAETRVEYENVFALGPLCGITDPDAVLAASHRCDELGLDTISAGGTIAFAMECRERGLLPQAPCFGDAKAVLALLDDIAARRGLGELLAYGSRRAALRLGQGTLAFAPQVKGLELPGYDPRAQRALALGYAVGSRGADHNKSGAYAVGPAGASEAVSTAADTARLAIASEDAAALTDSLIVCKFLRGVFADLYAEAAELLRAVTGWDFSAAELEATAKRIVALRKAFNIREGWRPEDDGLPERFLTERLAGAGAGGAEIARARLAEMIESYNLARGWTRAGYLTRAVVSDLALDAGAGGTASIGAGT